MLEVYVGRLAVRERHIVGREVVERPTAQTSPEPCPHLKFAVLRGKELVHEVGIAISLLAISIVLWRVSQSSEHVDHRADQEECTERIDLPRPADAAQGLVEDRGAQC